MASPVMRSFDRVLRAVAAKHVTVTIVGESGAGKEIMARRLHDLSPRRSGPFVPINCAAIPETLFESELFGHERGAYTGATETAPGKVEMASGGTLFLDEVAEIPIALQPKPCASSRRIATCASAGTASTRPTYCVRRTARSRPKPRRRSAKICNTAWASGHRPQHAMPRRYPRVARRFVAHLSAMHDGPPPAITRAARNALISYQWPGNVRELKNVVELLCILRAGKRVRVQDLPAAVRAASGDPRAADAITIHLDRPLSEIIERVVGEVVAIERGNLSRAAERLGVSVRTLQRRRHA